MYVCGGDLRGCWSVVGWGSVLVCVGRPGLDKCGEGSVGGRLRLLAAVLADEGTVLVHTSS